MVQSSIDWELKLDFQDTKDMRNRLEQNTQPDFHVRFHRKTQFFRRWSFEHLQLIALGQRREKKSEHRSHILKVIDTKPTLIYLKV